MRRPRRRIAPLRLDARTLNRALALINRIRRNERPLPASAREAIEELCATLLGADRHLAVYGSLAPGKENHHVLAGLRGSWSEGYVEGVLSPDGWGMTMGYPAIRWQPGAGRVPVHLFASDDLPDNWERIDAFEGPQYVRILVPVFRQRQVVAVGNVYEAR